MISISVNVADMRMETEGHAGFAPIGEDIVCAGVTTLLYTLQHNLSLLLYPDEYTADMREGHAYIEAHPPDQLREACRNIFMVIANGLFLMESNYGQYIQIEGE